MTSLYFTLLYIRKESNKQLLE